MPTITEPAIGLKKLRQSIDARLGELLPAETMAPQNLSRAIRYAALAPGKRLRGTLTLLAADTRPGAAAVALDPACAIEMVHAASLIIDDLPIMDDAIMRRGQPTVHRIFGEDTATLAAFALLNRAYGVIGADGALAPALRTEIVVLLHQAVGTQGLIGGQELDLHEDYSSGDATGLSDMYQQKTGVLFIAAAETGARIAGLDADGIAALRRFARYLGLAYQIADDLADIQAAPAGEPTDGDEANIVSTLGREKSQHMVEGLVERAIRSLDPLGARGAPLAQLAASIFGQRQPDPPAPARQVARA